MAARDGSDTLRRARFRAGLPQLRHSFSCIRNRRKGVSASLKPAWGQRSDRSNSWKTRLLVAAWRAMPRSNEPITPWQSRQRRPVLVREHQHFITVADAEWI